MLGKEQSKPKEMKKEKNRAEIMEQKTNTFQTDSKQNKKSVLETTREISGKIFQEKIKILTTLEMEKESSQQIQER